MNEKYGPWLSAIFCAFLSGVTVIGSLLVRWLTDGSENIALVFYCFLPSCFMFVGIFLSKLQKENHELRSKIDSLMAIGDAKETTNE